MQLLLENGMGIKQIAKEVGVGVGVGVVGVGVGVGVGTVYSVIK